MTVCMYTPTGEAHGLIGRLTNSVEFNDWKHMSPEIKAKVQKEMKEDGKVVKVRYINSRGNHERLTKPYCRYPGNPIEQYHLIPGYIYEVPMGFVKEVNAIKIPQRSGLVSLDGKDLKTGGEPLDKDDFNCQPLHQLVPASF